MDAADAHDGTQWRAGPFLTRATTAHAVRWLKSTKNNNNRRPSETQTQEATLCPPRSSSPCFYRDGGLRGDTFFCHQNPSGKTLTAPVERLLAVTEAPRQAALERGKLLSHGEKGAHFE